MPIFQRVDRKNRVRTVGQNPLRTVGRVPVRIVGFNCNFQIDSPLVSKLLIYRIVVLIFFKLFRDLFGTHKRQFNSYLCKDQRKASKER